PFLPYLALLCLVALVGVHLAALLTRAARKGAKVPFVVGLLHAVGRLVGILGLFYLPATLGGELVLLLGGGCIGRAVAELAGSFLGIMFGYAVLVGPMEPRANDPAARRPFAERAALRPRWRLLTVLTLLAAMVVTPFWLDWRDGPSAVPLGRSYQIMPGPGSITALALSSEGHPVTLSASPDGTLFLWDVSLGQKLRQIPGLWDAMGCAAITPDGRALVTGSASATNFLRRRRDVPPGELDPVVHLWDAESGKEQRAFKGHRAA